MKDDERCGRSKEVNTPDLIGQAVRVRVLVIMLRFYGSSGREIRSEEASTLQIGSVAFPPGQYTSPQFHPCHKLFDQDGHQDSSSVPYSPDLALGDFCLFPKLRGCRHNTIEGIKETMTKVIDMLGQEDFHGALHKLLKWYKCTAAGGDYFEVDKSFIWVPSIKVSMRKKSGNLFNDPRS